MAVCTKLKIASWLLPSGLRIQSFSKGHEVDGSTRNITVKGESIKNSQLNVKSYECSRSDINMNCFASGANAKYMEYLFSKWIKNVNSVHKSWHLYFSELVGSQSKRFKAANQSVTAIDAYKDKCKSKSELKVCLDELSKREETGSIPEIEEWNLKSKNPSSDGSSSWPPIPPQEQTCVVGHINLSPFIDNEITSKDASDKPINVQDMIKNMSKSSNKKDKSSFNVNKKQLKKNDHLRNIKRIKTALQQKAYKAGQKGIKEQLEKPKSVEPKKGDANAGIKVKKSSEPTRK